jgi:3-dehydroquinate dehydratase II
MAVRSAPSRAFSANGVELMAKVLVINGPNLGALGQREPEVYGTHTLAELEEAVTAQARDLGVEVAFFQSDSERELIARIRAAADDGTTFMLVNPAGLTHTSVPLRDAIAAVRIPFIEVHLSNPHAREPFRHRSLFSDLAVGVVSGFGIDSYELALAAAAR